MIPLGLNNDTYPLTCQHHGFRDEFCMRCECSTSNPTPKLWHPLIFQIAMGISIRRCILKSPSWRDWICICVTRIYSKLKNPAHVAKLFPCTVMCLIEHLIHEEKISWRVISEMGCSFTRAGTQCSCIV